MLKNTSNQWGLISQLLHWGIAFLMVLVIALGLIGDYLPNSGEKIKIFIYHKSIGITILAIVLFRIYWKLSQAQPNAAEGITEKQHKMANLGHVGLYLLMLGLPLSGWLLNSAAGFPFKWMDLFPVPSIPGLSGELGESLKPLFSQAHEALFWVLVAVLLGHIGMALLHHLKHKNAVLSRMLPSSHKVLWLSLLAIGFALAAFVFTKTFTQPSAPTATQSTANSLSAVIENVSHTDKQWLVVSEESTLGFTNNYDGIEFEGEFSDFTASMYFDEASVADGFFDVTIDIRSVTTFTPEWDSSLPDEEWFHIMKFPQARYQTTAIEKQGDDYLAQGRLSLKGVRQSVPLSFAWTPREDGKVDFIGTAAVNRTLFGIGSGMWQNDSTIGFDVKINIKLVLEEKE